jgi:small subunit ribosomal protein S16
VAVKIRLARIGAKGQPSYRVVVADERAARSGRTIEIIGTYNPLLEPASFVVDKEKVLSWLKKGAIPSDTVRKMLGKIGVLPPVDFTNFKKRAPKDKGGAKEASPAPTEAAPAQK